MVGVSFQPLLAVGSSARTFTFIGFCSSATSSLDFSSLSAGAIQANDLAVYIDYAETNGSLPSSVTPSGFTNDATGNNGMDTRLMISSKKLTGSETTITGMNGGNANNKIGLVFRPSSLFTSIVAHTATVEVTTGNPTLQTQDPSGETTASIVVGAAGHLNSTVSFSTFSPGPDGTALTANSDLIAGWNIFNTSPASTSIDMNDLGNFNALGSLYYTFT